MSRTTATDTRERIDQVLYDLTGYLRLYVSSQGDLWKQVPWWALEADDRTEFGNQLFDAYTNRIWWLHGPNGRLAVDLVSGQIVHAKSGDSPRRKVDDAEILSLALVLNQLDATNVIHHLRERAKNPAAGLGGKDGKDGWKKEVREKTGLTPPDRD